MYQCKFCNYTSVKRCNVQRHEKQKHLTVNLVKNNQINYKEIKVEDDPPSAQEATIENDLLEILKNEAEK